VRMRRRERDARPHASPALHDPYREPAPHAPRRRRPPTRATSVPVSPMHAVAARGPGAGHARVRQVSGRFRRSREPRHARRRGAPAGPARSPSAPAASVPARAGGPLRLVPRVREGDGADDLRQALGNRRGRLPRARDVVRRGRARRGDGVRSRGGLEADLAEVPPPATDASTRAMEATLTVQLMHQQQEDEELVKDVAYLLSNPLRRLQRQW